MKSTIYNKVSSFSTKIVAEKFGNLPEIPHLCSAKTFNNSIVVGGCSILEHTHIGDNLSSAYPPQWLVMDVLANLEGYRLLYYITLNLSETMPKHRENARISGTSSAQCAGTYSCNNNGLLAPLSGERVDRILIS